VCVLLIGLLVVLGGTGAARSSHAVLSALSGERIGQATTVMRHLSDGMTGRVRGERSSKSEYLTIGSWAETTGALS
jgi:hypothetical protein